MPGTPSIPPPPRRTGDADADMAMFAQWFYRFYTAAVIEGGLLRADQQEVEQPIDPASPPSPASTTLATAQATANTALVAATATAALFPALAGQALKVPRVAAGQTAFEFVSTAQLVADGGGVANTLTLTAGAGLTGGGNLTANRSFAVDFTAVVPATRTVSAGTGLTGGGALSGNVTVSLQTDWGTL